MATIVKIKNIRLVRLNNAEFVNFCGRINANIADIGYAATGLTKEIFDQFGDDERLLTDIEQQSRTSDLTAQIAAANRECDESISYILNLISAGRTSPVEAYRAAATTLFNVTKPYRGIQKLAHGQQIAQTRGLIADLEKPANIPLGATLGLWTAIGKLLTANDRFFMLINTRAAEQSAADLGPAAPVRQRQTERWDTMASMIFAESVARPTEETAAAIDAINTTIDDVNRSYNQRMAQIHAAKKREEESGTGAEDARREALRLRAVADVLEGEAHRSPEARQAWDDALAAADRADAHAVRLEIAHRVAVAEHEALEEVCLCE